MRYEKKDEEKKLQIALGTFIASSYSGNFGMGSGKNTLENEISTNTRDDICRDLV